MNRKFVPLIMALSLCLGCGSEVPFATTCPWDTQRKMQAARHWEILAGDLARQVKKCVRREGLKRVPVYVVPRDGSPFEEIFQGLLISELMDRGPTVSRTPDDSLKMEYSATVRYLLHQ